MSSWVMNFNTVHAANQRLLCFPYAGGGASMYAPWAKLLPKNVQLSAVQLPGRENRFDELPTSDFNVVIDRIEEAVRGLSPALPIAFFGHSLGATLAFEVAKRLTGDQRYAPTHLFVSGRRAPSMPRIREGIHNLPDEEFVSELRQLNCTSEEILCNEQLMELLMPRLRADFALSDEYTSAPSGGLECPMSIFGGVNDIDVGHDEICDWARETSGPAKVTMFEGDHFFVSTHQAEVTRLVSDTLEVSMGGVGRFGTLKEVNTLRV